MTRMVSTDSHVAAGTVPVWTQMSVARTALTPKRRMASNTCSEGSRASGMRKIRTPAAARPSIPMDTATKPKW